jgi:hypothetical protein
MLALEFAGQPAGSLRANVTSAKGTRVMKGKELLRVCVLGHLAVLRHSARMQLPPSKKTRALLAYLAVTARPHSRDRLCAMLWAVPDDPRAALRWSLSRLRPLVDEPDRPRIIADRDNVGLDLDRVTVDILSLRNVARNGTFHLDRCTAPSDGGARGRFPRGSRSAGLPRVSELVHRGTRGDATASGAAS